MRRYFPYLQENRFTFFKQWERIYLEEGAGGHMKERRGKAVLPAAPGKAVKRNTDTKTKECAFEFMSDGKEETLPREADSMCQIIR